MDQMPGAAYQKAIDIRAISDIRAPYRLNWHKLFRWRWHRAAALLLCDTIALAIAGRVAAHLNQFYAPLPPPLVLGTWLGLPGLFWILMTITLLLFTHSGLYSASSQWKYVQSGKLISVVYILALLLGYFYDPKLAPPRSLFLTAWLGSVILVISFRLLASLVLKQFEHAQTKIFLLAQAERLPTLTHTLQRRSRYQIVGTALASTIGISATIQTILDSGAQEVLAESLPQTDLASGLYWQLRRAGITLRLIPSSVEMLHRRGVPEVVAGIPTLRMEATLLGGWDYRLKRWFDWLGAFFALILLSPLLTAVAIAIKLSSPGAVFFCQERMGLHGRVFQMWKFRTMIPEAEALQAALEQQNEAGDGVMFKIRRDPRITAIGHFLRHTSIDELPQLVNVLLGQMSLVGPRPLPLRDVERFDPWHHTRHQVLPGITGLWQVSGRSSVDAFNDAARLDLYYIDNWSLNLDLEILLETVKIVVCGKGAY